MRPPRVGWCPGALAPMTAGDGLILRIKPRGARLSREQAHGIAGVARRYGNGALDLTQRANLQIRGLAEPDLPAALDDLGGFGLLDPTPQAEAVRNVVSSPLAGEQGISRAEVIDISACVAALEDRLVDTPALHDLPAKFGFVVDDGGALGLRDVPADIRFEAFGPPLRPAFAVRLGGGEEQAAGVCRIEDIADVAEALACVLLRARSDDPSLRMAGLVARNGAGEILRQAGLDLVDAPRPDAKGPRDVVGDLGAAFGIGAPFGRLHADQLDAIAASAGSGLRLTPWRAILLLGAAGARRLAGIGLIVDAADPRLAIVACVGAPECRRATTAVIQDAARLAARLRLTEGGVAVHVSGCAKGCAHHGCAPLTLVGRDGRYDRVRDGRAADPPIDDGLDIETALRSIGRRAEADLVA